MFFKLKFDPFKDTITDNAIYVDVSNGAASTLKNVYFHVRVFYCHQDHHFKIKDSSNPNSSKTPPSTTILVNNREKNFEMAYWALQGKFDLLYNKNINNIFYISLI